MFIGVVNILGEAIPHGNSGDHLREVIVHNGTFSFLRSCLLLITGQVYLTDRSEWHLRLREVHPGFSILPFGGVGDLGDFDMSST